jgi:hypothetical protein
MCRSSTADRLTEGCQEIGRGLTGGHLQIGHRSLGDLSPASGRLPDHSPAVGR